MKLFLLNFIFPVDRLSPKHLAHQNMQRSMQSRINIHFVPKFKLPVLDRYDLTAPRNYWCHWPTKSNNAPSGFECGDRVSD